MAKFPELNRHCPAAAYIKDKGIYQNRKTTGKDA
jgi:hypothetical protein